MIAAYAGEPVACSTWQGFRTCSGPGGYRSTETQRQGMTLGQDNRGNSLDDQPLAGFDTTTVEPR